MDKKTIYDIEFVFNEPIENITTYKTKGTVKGVIYPKNEYELKVACDHFKQSRLPFIIIGNGSNFLISPYSNKYIISTKKIEQKITYSKGHLNVSCSTPLARVFNFCLIHKLSGFEALAGIPGSIGGAIKMNASCFGHSISDNLVSIKVYAKGKFITIKREDIKFGYHTSNLDDFIIISAKFKLNEEKNCIIKRNFTNYLIKRTRSQPKGLSCGSTFKNPQGHFAGKLIEECGLKGYRCNGAQISPIHGNFIINYDNAQFEDIKRLIEFCQSEVYKKFKIKLEPEVEIIT